MTQAQSIISKLKRHYSDEIERDVFHDEPKFRAWHDREGLQGWEVFSVPEINNYQSVISSVTKDDVIFDVGAGDLRLDLMLCEKVKRVYAVEVNPRIIGDAIKIIGYDFPKNLVAIRANAFDLPLPEDVTVVICLMIHRQRDFPEKWMQRKIIFAMHDGLFTFGNGFSEISCIREGDP